MITPTTMPMMRRAEGACRGRHESRFDWDIDRQMKVTNGYYRELMEANGSLEAVDYV